MACPPYSIFHSYEFLYPLHHDSLLHMLTFFIIGILLCSPSIIFMSLFSVNLLLLIIVDLLFLNLLCHSHSFSSHSWPLSQHSFAFLLIQSLTHSTLDAYSNPLLLALSAPSVSVSISVIKELSELHMTHNLHILS